mmetsp:Transcript_68749/g.182855  ORF Transcript_68749/g.182855 Transcript_68749/m.182855 type:complete len:520 (-) Transcript_68749:253-1812(-)
MAGRKVFVGSLPNGVNEEGLQAEFSKYGQVTEVFVKQGCEPGRQWAFVTFATPEQAQFVKESCDRVLIFPGNDRPCDVMLAKNQGTFGRDSDQHGGAYGGNGYGYQQGGAPDPNSTAARKCFVGSLPDGIMDETIRAEFSKYGHIEDVFIKQGCESGRQWCFITFSSPDQAAMAAATCNGILQFAGSIKACEVTLARNQGMFGQSPVNGGGMAAGGGGYGGADYGGYSSQGLSDAQVAPRKIFVGSLPDSISDPILRGEFGKYGQITDLFMKTTCESGRQWAFITFVTPEQAQFARNSCDKVLTFPGADRPCEVTMARHQGLFGKESIEPGVIGAVAAPAYGIEGPRKIFVGSLPDSITDGMLRSEFSKYGQIHDLYLKTTCEPGRQWAFITFASNSEAQYAKDATDRVLQFPGADRTCEVMLAKNQGKFGQAPLDTFGRGGGGAPPRAALMAPMEAAQPPPPDAPPPAHLTPWRIYKTASGLPYYHNTTTGVTQWDCPPDFQVPGQQVAAGQQRYSPY